MKLISILLILSTALTTTVTALDEFSFFPHHPPPPNAVRGPCPALNSLANHGFIPRDGRNLRVPALVFALGKALNVSTEVANKVASAGLRTSSNPNSGTFTLEDLGKHNIIEHDASLSREDVDLGGGLDLRKEVWEEFLGYVNGTGNGRFGLRDAARARWGRVQTSKARNPKFTYSPSGQFNSYVESAIYFELFKDPASMTTSLGFVKVFFGTFCSVFPYSPLLLLSAHIGADPRSNN